MKRSGLWLLFFLGIMPGLWSQITVTNSVFPEVGDTLYYAVDNAPSGIVMTPPGGDQQWDFSGLNRTLTMEEVYRDAREGMAFSTFPAATLVYQAEMGGPETYLRVTPQDVAILGLSGAGPVTFGLDLDLFFRPPFVQQRAPLNFFDITQSSTGILLAFPADLFPVGGQLPITADSFRVRVSISRLDVIDAWGSLTIPGGQYDVLRQKGTTYTETRLDAKIPPLGWLDITDLAVQFLNLPGLGVDTAVNFQFINDVSKEPIAICATDGSQLNVINVQFKNTDRTTSIQPRHPENLKMVVFPNPASEVLNIQGEMFSEGALSVIISSVSGQDLLQRDIYGAPGQTDMSLDISGLEKGLFVCRILRKGEVIASGTFIKE
jgi:hypothetical protein